MQSDEFLIYHCGNLRICPQLGEVSNSEGATVRLGPVNMKVLALLVSHPLALVSRNEIFETVWKNQVVSDDALTRCISDIRSQLKTLCPTQEFIETLPRRGYRWLATVSNAAVTTEENTSFTPTSEKTQSNLTGSSSIFYWLKRIFLYFIAIVVIATISVWLADRFNQAKLPTIALIQTNNGDLKPQSVKIEEAITAKILATNNLSLLSKTAVSSAPNNPFPYFYFEFGVRWVIESDVQIIGENEVILTLSLVDARTGIILYQTAETVSPANLNDTVYWQENDSVESLLEQLNALTNSMF